jgi:DNA-binding MarR family transcriptional regulator
MSSPEQSRNELINALNIAMREVSGHGTMYSQAVAQRLGINSTDLECLDQIVLRGPLAAGALAEATGLTTGAITGVIDRLEKAGFARREQDPEDRRRVLVRTEPIIIERIAPLFAPMQRAALDALAPYRDDELRLLLDFLKRTREAALTAMAELRTLSTPQGAATRRGRARR